MRHLLFAFIFYYTLSASAQILPGAYQTESYLDVIKKKKIALVVNQTSFIGRTHLVDSLLKLGINIECIFAPEHGFRGNVSAGTTVNSGKDAKTGITIISLYGNHKKPTPEDLNGVEYVIFDIQDVGVRFYTYISTMHYVMEACAENNIPFLVLDRPNPNGHYIDGPVLDTTLRSFVGMHPIPLVHGCTVAEIAQMINGEGWLNNKVKCALEIVKVKNYKHNLPYILPIKPSPNLQTQSSIYLYPSLGLFEGTSISMGHGTDKPYQSFGSPDFTWGNLKISPRSIKGVYEAPKFLNHNFIGFDLTQYGDEKAFSDGCINLNWLLIAYQSSVKKEQFFIPFFEKLAGTTQLRKQIIDGKSVYEIRQTWEKDLEKYRKTRQKYVLYE
jgi:uncharacterized protein YbbC (DUF1343 family)